MREELPLLAVLGLFPGWLLWDGYLSRLDSVLLLILFFGLISFSVYAALRNRGDALEEEVEQELASHAMPLKRAMIKLISGLLLLIVSSYILIWAAVSTI